MKEKTVPVQEIIGMINDITVQLEQLESHMVKAMYEETEQHRNKQKASSQELKRNFEKFEESFRLYELSVLPIPLHVLNQTYQSKPKYTF